MKKTFREFACLLLYGPLPSLLLALTFGPVAALAQYGGYGFPMARPVPVAEGPSFASNLGSMVLSALLGGLIGAFCSQKFKENRKYFWRGLLAISVLVCLFHSSILSSFIGFWIGFVAAYCRLYVATRKAQKWRSGHYLRLGSMGDPATPD